MLFFKNSSFTNKSQSHHVYKRGLSNKTTVFVGKAKFKRRVKVENLEGRLSRVLKLWGEIVFILHVFGVTFSHLFSLNCYSSLMHWSQRVVPPLCAREGQTNMYTWVLPVEEVPSCGSMKRESLWPSLINIWSLFTHWAL